MINCNVATLQRGGFSTRRSGEGGREGDEAYPGKKPNDMASKRIDVHRAVERGDLAVLTRYLDAGGDVEKKDTEYGAAPVHWASLVRSLRVY